MKYTYLVLGAGRQGVALAYDLVRNAEAKRLILADADRDVATRAVDRLRTLLPGAACELAGVGCDVAEGATLERLMAGVNVVCSAVPYRFNVGLTDAAIAAGAHFNDLGGNTDVVREQLARHAKAGQANVTVVPDCGLAPGLGNIVAAYGVSLLDQPLHAHVRCGGLPQRPVGPLGYKLLFNFQGLINEYSGHGEFLRNGMPVRVPTLTELEPIDFPPPIGRCEAAVTSGGTSTCAESFLGRLQSYDYKTVRYPGHFAIVRAMFALGCFEERVALRGGGVVEPKHVLRQLMEDRLAYPEIRDITVLRITVSGLHGGKPRSLQWDLLDRHDETTGFTAMERTTSFPTSVVAHMQARGLIQPGAQPLEKCIPLAQYMSELPRHDIRFEFSERG
ncbi:MAG: saccharopine dehydrogenase NADP-binding domain-containing protein [Planctomycetes bacterium]|nr:saccharopine dehydrogenase NADP-binding domain-containing protein [Planctomycetota bacterium]